MLLAHFIWLFIYDMCFFFFKTKTAYDVRISAWISDVCSSDLLCEASQRSGRHDRSDDALSGRGGGALRSHRHHQSWPPDREQADARACQYGSGKGRGGDGRPRSGRSADAWLFRKGRTDRGTRADNNIYEGPGPKLGRAH